MSGGELRRTLGGRSIAGDVCAPAALCRGRSRNAGANSQDRNTGRRDRNGFVRGANPRGIRRASLPPVDRIVSLEEVWGNSIVERLFESLVSLPLRQRLGTLSRALVVHTSRGGAGECIGDEASRLMTSRRGRVSIEEMASHYGVTRQNFARTFSAATGLTPKLFARVTRFQAVVNALLTCDVSEWVSVAPAMGFYDQAHMINEFREFAGSPPTVFFQPHDDKANTRGSRLRGVLPNRSSAARTACASLAAGPVP